MTTLDVPRPSARPTHDRRTGPRARVRGLAAERSLPVLFALSLLAAPAAAGGAPATEPATRDASAPEVAGAQRAGRSGLVPRLFGPSRRAAGGASAGIPHSRAASSGQCTPCEPLRAFDPADFERPNRIRGDWLPLDPGEHPWCTGLPGPEDVARGRGASFPNGSGNRSGGTVLDRTLDRLGAWMPIVRGRQHVYQARSNEDGAMLDHHLTFTVTDLFKDIGGLPCAVVLIEDVDHGQPVESVLSFFAQDRRGDIWHTGEYAEEYEQGQYASSDATWLHGLHLARGGVLVQRRPDVGVVRELAKAARIQQLDCGREISVEQGREAPVPGVCVPAGCFREVMTLEEWAPSEGCPEFLHRIYARGVGLIQAGAPDDPTGETLVLMGVRQLRDPELRVARRAALALDDHGPQVNEVYSFTQPAYRLPRLTGDPGSPETAWGNDERGLAPPAQETFLSVGHEPQRPGRVLRWGLAAAAQVELGVFDLAGRRVRTLVSGEAAAGVHRIDWDGRDDFGHEVARGVYFARLRLGARALNRTLVLTR